LNIRELKI